MNTNKNFLTRFGELIDEYRQEKQATTSQTSSPQPEQRWLRALRWLTPNGGTLLIVLILIFTQNVWANPSAATSAPGPSATTINYQGRLADKSGNPLTGTYGMEFALYDAATDGAMIWGSESHSTVSVSGGLFSVGLGSKTTGGIPTNVWNGDRYLQITVNGETLTPRELIRSVPVAGMALMAQSALTVPDGAIGTNQLSDGSITTTKLADGSVVTSKLGDEVVTSRKINVNSGIAAMTSGFGMNITPQCYTREDIPGASASITVDSNVVALTTAMFDLHTDGSTAAGTLLVDNVAVGAEAVHIGSRSTVFMNYWVPLSPGTHILKLAVCKFGANAYVNNASFMWFIVSQ